MPSQQHSSLFIAVRTVVRILIGAAPIIVFGWLGQTIEATWYEAGLTVKFVGVTLTFVYCLFLMSEKGLFDE